MERFGLWNVVRKEADSSSGAGVSDPGPSRLASLTDGIFAVVMTLLILDIKIIPDQAITSNHQLRDHLLSLLPRLEIFIFTIMVLGIFWMIHQLQFRYIRQSDRNLVWINILFLMFIIFVPFSMHLISTYNSYKIASMVFSCNMFLIGILLYVNWRYSTYNNRLTDPDLSRDIIEFGLTRNHMMIGTTVIAIILSFFSAHLSLFSYVLYPVMQLFHKKRS